ncbi:hypothetical protein GCM10010458_27040 [Microbacterium luteolum]|uniref:Molybdenum ABC transporter substrate-binding protein n=1 Tax=Microbacterium luteolum TaxID=69367 RepID=A0ABY7XVM6_MICLT|nr:hypothetical protein [Microbacterium luteolum]WDM45318.1 hypothetical protein KV395_19605 [Microbacterium luteolum]
MKHIATGILLVGALATILVGCSGTSGSDAAAEKLPNVAACKDFAALTLDLDNRVAENDVLLEPLADLNAEFDTIALSADGDVKTRMMAVEEAIPDPPHMVVFGDNREVYNDAIDAVSRACTAADAEVTVTPLTHGVG